MNRSASCSSAHVLVPRLVVGVLLASLSATAHATEVKLFRADQRPSFMEGTLEEVSVDPLGALALAARLERTARLDEPFVFDAAPHPDGWVVGTGNSGRVLLVDRAGAVRTLFEAPEPEVFAVWADEEGIVYAGTSPQGKVYRIDPTTGESSVIFEPSATYIWDLAPDSSGRLLVATGLPGEVYRLGRRPKADGAPAERIIDSGDRHVRTLAPLSRGSLLAGTAGHGLILRLERDGTTRNLYDAAHPEVLAFAVAPGGVAYAALLASEASYVDLSGGNGSSNSDDEGDDDSEASVSVTTGPVGTVGSRAAGFSGPRSIVVRIDESGGVEEVWGFEDETVHAMLWHQDGLWIGTGQDGGLYRWHDEQMVLEHSLDEHQITGLVALAGETPALVTTNGAALYQLPGGPTREGTYTSPVLDASQVARFGSFFWRGTTPPGTSITFLFRSGMGAEPDATWTAWSEAVAGDDLPLTSLASGRYVQWRATLSSNGKRSPRIQVAELSYRQLNRRPAIEKIEVLDPGQVIVPSSFNPQNQTFEPWSPNRDGIFTTLGGADTADDARTKTLWKKGYRTIRWSASDPNEDELRFDLGFRRVSEDGSNGSDSDDWLPMATDLEESHYSFDATVLPDGVYRFRLKATDREAEPAATALDRQEISPPVVVDHSVPTIEEPMRSPDAITVAVADRWNPLRDARYSVDGGDWQGVAVDDGLLDGRRETLRLEVPEATRLVLLRVTDAAFNVVTFDLSPSK